MDARYLMLVFKGPGKYAGHPPPRPTRRESRLAKLNDQAFEIVVVTQDAEKSGMLVSA